MQDNGYEATYAETASVYSVPPATSGVPVTLHEDSGADNTTYNDLNYITTQESASISGGSSTPVSGSLTSYKVGTINEPTSDGPGSVDPGGTAVSIQTTYAGDRYGPQDYSGETTVDGSSEATSDKILDMAGEKTLTVSSDPFAERDVTQDLNGTAASDNLHEVSGGTGAIVNQDSYTPPMPSARRWTVRRLTVRRATGTSSLPCEPPRRH